MLPGLEQSTEERREWGNDTLRVAIAHGPDSAPRLLAVWHVDEDAPDSAARRRSALPLLEVAVLGEGREGTAGKRHVDGAAAQRMRMADWRELRRGDVAVLEIDIADLDSGLFATVVYELADGVPVLRTWARVTSEHDALLEYATTGVLSGLGHSLAWEDDLILWDAPNPWSGEFRWRSASLATRGLYDVGMSRYGQVGAKNRIAMTSTGAWSTSERLAEGILQERRSGRMLAWHIESNGAWHTELGDRYGDVYLAAMGPTALEHQWSGRVGPEASVDTVPVAFAVVVGNPHGDDATLADLGAALTRHRRRTRRAHPDHDGLPVVYNDFLNALMSDPTSERERPLIDAAAALGVEYYVIDAGWYDDESGGWWDAVGAWLPSERRFPDGGLDAVIDRIRSAGMRPGLWLEPEVVGVRSEVAQSLPPEAFYQRDGRRVTEWGRHQLDLRHPAAKAHLDSVVDRLVERFGLSYLKLDYNIDIGAGTDRGAGEAPGTGLREASSAFLAWVSEIMDRHPGLVIEGCAAGGSRLDAASARVFPVQSLTDQQDFMLTPPIAVAAPLTLPPEQSGVWASVDGGMSDEETVFSLVTAMLSRVHLAGRIDTLRSSQRRIVSDALAVHRSLRGAASRAVPIWPLGLPGWRDEWIVRGARDADDLYLAVWRRDGATADAELRVPLPGLTATGPVSALFPVLRDAPARIVDGGSAVLIRLPPGPCARLYRLTVADHVLPS
ncbi:glycoside hydrolase family 36 protein [Microbacterium karelineae]|uniref:glycoside hydrolase family 36 protein n=1 Tax=Microbacterium karelineae TaxID=2654283 RepID=UPI001E61B0D9|nr:glycoside hydrolase family 36 protein [Microbacterium karelineae]